MHYSVHLLRASSNSPCVVRALCVRTPATYVTINPYTMIIKTSLLKMLSLYLHNQSSTNPGNGALSVPHVIANPLHNDLTTKVSSTCYHWTYTIYRQQWLLALYVVLTLHYTFQYNKRVQSLLVQSEVYLLYAFPYTGCRQFACCSCILVSTCSTCYQPYTMNHQHTSAIHVIFTHQSSTIAIYQQTSA